MSYLAGVRMTEASTRIYYHLYNGPSWRPVWHLHRAALEAALETGGVERLVVCCGGFAELPSDLGLDPARCELRAAPRRAERVNEFDTLAYLRQDCLDDPAGFRYVAYLHSKGSSSPQLTPQGRSWASWLACALCEVIKQFAPLAEAGFAAAGSNLAWGLFHHFEAPRLHFSGNFWCATRESIRATRPIDLQEPESSVRHRAEWWLTTAPPSASYFNLFCSGLDHYAPEGRLIDEDRLRARIASLAQSRPDPIRARAQQEFVRRHVQSVMPAAAGRRLVSQAVLAALPYRSVPRAYSAHDALMRLLGSRRSAYFYCAES